MTDSKAQYSGVQTFQFGNWTFCTESSALTNNSGGCITLEPRLSKLLHIFCLNPGRLLTKDFLLEEIWAPRIVSEESITVAVSQLRKVLGQTNEKIYIKTLSGKGYSWIPEVSEIQRNNRIKIKIYAAVVILSIAIAAGFMLLPVSTEEEQVVLDNSNELSQRIEHASSMIATNPDDAIEAFRLMLNDAPIGEVYLGLLKAKMAKVTPRDYYKHQDEFNDLLAKVRELSPELPELDRLASQLNFYGNWDFANAQLYSQKVYDAGERSPEFLLEYAEIMLAMGDFRKVKRAVTELRRQHPEFYAVPSVAWLHLMMGNTADALREINRIFDVDIAGAGHHASAHLIGLIADNDEMAWQHLKELMQKDDLSEPAISRYESIYQREGLKQVHAMLQTELPSDRLGHYQPPLSVGRHAIVAGNRSDALNAIRTALEERQLEMLWFYVDPLYKALVDMPEYQELVSEFKVIVNWP